MAGATTARRAPAIGLAAVLCAATLYLSVPRLVAAVLLFPGDRPLQALQNERIPSIAELEAIASSRTAAMRWIDQGQLWTDRSLARLTLIQDAAKGKEPAAALRQSALRDLDIGLALAPVSPYAWARLAYVRFLQNGSSPGVASALRLSFLTGPFEREMIFERLRLALAVYSNFSSEERELVRRQIRFAWLLSRDDLVELAILSQRTLVFRLALVNQPQDLAIFDSMLKERS
jgi:hypothetical protein